MTLKPPIGPPANADATEQRRWMFGKLTLQNFIQGAIFVAGLLIMLGEFRATAASQAVQVEQNKTDIVEIKKAREEDRKIQDQIAGDIKLILYRLDEQDKRAAKP